MRRRSLKNMIGKIRLPRSNGEGVGRIREAEQAAMAAMDYVPKPKDQELANLLELAGGGRIKQKAFDCLLLPSGVKVDFGDKRSIKKNLRRIVFIDLKTTARQNVQPDFWNYYFSVSANQLKAAELLGDNFRFVFYNLLTGAVLILTLNQLLARIRGWHVSYSVQI